MVIVPCSFAVTAFWAGSDLGKEQAQQGQHGQERK